MKTMIDDTSAVVLTDNFLLKLENFNTQVLEYKETLPHSHEFFEIVYVLNGSAKHICNNKTEKLQVGNTFLLRPQKDTHHYESIDGQQFTHRDILVSKELLKKVCDFLSPELFDKLYSASNPIQIQLSLEHLSL